MILTILNGMACGIGWIAIGVLVLWVIGQFVLWMTSELKGRKRRIFNDELEGVLRDLSTTVGDPYPEISKACDVIRERVISKESTTSNRDLLNWLRRHHPKW